MITLGKGSTSVRHRRGFAIHSDFFRNNNVKERENYDGINN
ncbi:hypothetical protein [Heliorestis acidaminivorans]|nr:hypothetical protein [Heliorestis acidaminivorans]